MIDKELYEWIRTQKAGDVQKVTFDVENICTRVAGNTFELILATPIKPDEKGK